VNPLDVVVAPRHPEDSGPLEPDIALVKTGPSRLTHPKVVVEDVVRDDLPLRHDPDKLARVLMRVYEEERRARANGSSVRYVS
jgi:hypothetical protein